MRMTGHNISRLSQVLRVTMSSVLCIVPGVIEQLLGRGEENNCRAYGSHGGTKRLLYSRRRPH